MEKRVWKCGLICLALMVTFQPIHSDAKAGASPWACELKAFVTGYSSQGITLTPILTGQGLVNCRNVNGFNFDTPVRANLHIARSLKTATTEKISSSPRPPREADLREMLDTGTIKIVIFSDPFVIPGDTNQMYGSFEPQDSDVHGKGIPLRQPPKSNLMFRGKESGLLLPIAPFTVVNLVAGSMRMSFVSYIVGTIVGTVPGLIALTFLARRIGSALQTPDFYTIFLLSVFVLAMIAALRLIKYFLTDRYS